MGCRGEGGDWGLPDGITRQRELVGYMVENRVQAVWLGIQREVTPGDGSMEVVRLTQDHCLNLFKIRMLMSILVNV